MKKSRFSEQQIAFILRQAEEGTRVEEVCRKAGISEATYYNWRKKYGGLMPSRVCTTSAPRKLCRTSIAGESRVKVSTIVSTRNFRPSKSWSWTKSAALGGTAVFGLPQLAPLGSDSGASKGTTTDPPGLNNFQDGL